MNNCQELRSYGLTKSQGESMLIGRKKLTETKAKKDSNA